MFGSYGIFTYLLSCHIDTVSIEVAESRYQRVVTVCFRLNENREDLYRTVAEAYNGFDDYLYIPSKKSKGCARFVMRGNDEITSCSC